MPKTSAGLLVYRRGACGLEVLLVHPGGPFFQNKDTGAWSIPKGEPAPGEELLEVARREFREETGFDALGAFVELAPVKQKGGKTVHAWACQGNYDMGKFTSNEFEMEWPPKSGRKARFPEVDQAEYFPLEIAREKINPAQVALLDELEQRLTHTGWTGGFS